MSVEDDPQAALDNLRRVVRSGRYRMDVSTAFNMNTGKMVGAVYLWEAGTTRGGNFKWVRLSPFLTPADDQSMLELITMIAAWGLEDAPVGS